MQNPGHAQVEANVPEGRTDVETVALIKMVVPFDGEGGLLLFFLFCFFQYIFCSHTTCPEYFQGGGRRCIEIYQGWTGVSSLELFRLSNIHIS